MCKPSDRKTILDMVVYEKPLMRTDYILCKKRGRELTSFYGSWCLIWRLLVKSILESISQGDVYITPTFEGPTPALFNQLPGPGCSIQISNSKEYKEVVAKASQCPLLPKCVKAGVEKLWQHLHWYQWGSKWILVSLKTPTLTYLRFDIYHTRNNKPTKWVLSGR